MKSSSIFQINRNKQIITELFHPVEVSLLPITEEFLDNQIKLALKLKRIKVETNDELVNYYKLNQFGVPCYLPYISDEEEILFSEYNTLFYYLNVLILRHTPQPVRKNGIAGHYFKYKNVYFIANLVCGVFTVTYYISIIKPINGKKPIEVIPYSCLQKNNSVKKG